MCGKSLKELGFTQEVNINHVAVKESVFPFIRFPEVDTVLGPEMKSTGEVMGLDSNFGLAFVKSQLGAGQNLPMEGTVFISLKDGDKEPMIDIATRFIDLGFSILATEGTANAFNKNGIPVSKIWKISEGRPNILDYIKNNEVQLIINTPSGKTPSRHEVSIRTTAVSNNIPLVTTVAGASATIEGIEALKERGLSVKTIHKYNKEIS